MTVQEASKTCFGKPYVVDVEEHEEAIKTIKEALEEIEQYRTLGTVEELKEAREKQIPQKPTDIDEDVNTFVCPSCGHTLIALDDMTVHQHCLICGKALKWG